MAKVNFKRVETIKDIEKIQIEDGNLIVTADGNIFIDYEERRVPVGGTPDTMMSDESSNSVQNKVIKSYVDDNLKNKVTVDEMEKLKQQLEKNNKINDNTIIQNKNIKNEMILSAGEHWNDYGRCYYYKIGTRVHVHIGIKLSELKTVFIMPPGYRPIIDIFATGVGSNFNFISSARLISNGEIVVMPNDGYAGIDIEYDAFS